MQTGKMALRLSTRISIQWADDPAYEDTTTVVLSVGGHYMDLRIKKADQSIEWAFAGTREILSQDPLHCRWHHVIDSRLSFDPDEGKFHKLQNGDDLEVGSMPCPGKNDTITPYKEVWRELLPEHGTDRGWILQGISGDNTIFLGKYGGIYMAMAQGKDGVFSVLKEELVDTEGHLKWKGIYRSGNQELPSLESQGCISFPGEDEWQVGEAANIQGSSYIIQELQRRS